MISQVAALLIEHADLLDLIFSALAKGVTKDSLKDLITKSMVAVSDEQMKLELG